MEGLWHARSSHQYHSDSDDDSSSLSDSEQPYFPSTSSRIQFPHLKLAVLNYRISNFDLHPRELHVVIKYGGRKYINEDETRVRVQKFVIQLIEGLSEMDIYVLKRDTNDIAGIGKFLLSQGSCDNIQKVVLNTTSGRYIGEVILRVEYSKNITLVSRSPVRSWRDKRRSPELEQQVYNASDIMDNPNEAEESRSMKGSLGPINDIKVTEKLNDMKTSKEEDTACFEPSGGFLGEFVKNTPKQFSLIDLKIFTSDFADKAGQGGFGTVYKGQFREGTQIAVKVLKENGLIEKSFEAEVSTMFKTSHRNLVKFYGYCSDHNMKAIIYEYMENGSLDAILYGNPRQLEWQKFYQISIETAKGLSYLHDGCDHQILHHDLKPANILLDKNLSAKITDFGLARVIDKDATHVTWTNCGGTIGYMAPEIFMPSLNISSKCDAYSFGMILFEVLRMKKNDADNVWFPKQVWLKFDSGELEELIKDCGIHKEEDRSRAKTLCMVALWCTQFKSETRPSMGKVVMMLERQIPVEKPPNPCYS